MKKISQKFQIKIVVLLLLLSSTSLFSMEESLKRRRENDHDSELEVNKKRQRCVLSIDPTLCAEEDGAVTSPQDDLEGKVRS
jgi:hypothetical protein